MPHERQSSGPPQRPHGCGGVAAAGEWRCCAGCHHDGVFHERRRDGAADPREEAVRARGAGRAPDADRAGQPEGQRDRDPGRRNWPPPPPRRPTRCRRAARSSGRCTVCPSRTRICWTPAASARRLDLRSTRTTCPREDDIVVERMRRAGAITIGKTNTPEFGSGSQTFNTVFGATRNPYDLTKTCGGSSGGAAVALGVRAGACRQRIRYRRLASQSRRVLQRRGLSAFPRPRAQSEGRVRVVDAEHLGMPGAFGGGPRLRAEHDRRTRFPRAALNQRAWRTSSPDRSTAASRACVWPGSRTSAACPSIRACAPWWMRIARPSSRSGASSSRRSPTSRQPRSRFACCVRGTRRIRTASVSARTRTAFKDTLTGEIEEGLRLTGTDVARAETAHGQIWRRFQAFLEKYEYFVLPTTQLPPFDVNTPYPTEIAGVEVRELHRLDEVLLVHLGHRESGGLGAGRLHAGRTSRRRADRRPRQRGLQRPAAGARIRAGDRLRQATTGDRLKAAGAPLRDLASDV